MLYKVEWQQYEDVQEWESTGFNDLMEATEFYFEKQEDNYYVRLDQKLMENLNEEIVKKDSVEWNISHLPREFYVECTQELVRFFTKGLKYLVKNTNGEFLTIDDNDSSHTIRSKGDNGVWFKTHFKIQ